MDLDYALPNAWEQAHRRLELLAACHDDASRRRPGRDPRDAYDLVHTRLALLHIPERETVLARLAATLRPGGVLLLKEDDGFPIQATATGEYRAAWEVFLQIMAGGGTHPAWARNLPERLGALGLVDVDAEADAQLFRGGSTTAEMWSLTWVQVRERARAMDLPVEDLDRGRAVLGDPDRWFHGPTMIAAWGRRPV